MANRDIMSNVQLVQSLVPVVLTTNNTTVVGAAIDVHDCDAVGVSASVGVWGDTTTGGWEIGLQHSADTVSGNFVDVPAADMTYSFAGTSTVTGAQATGVFARVNAVADGSNIWTSSYVGNKRYIRHKITATGNQSTGTAMAININKGKLNIAPSTANVCPA